MERRREELSTADLASSGERSSASDRGVEEPADVGSEGTTRVSEGREGDVAAGGTAMGGAGAAAAASAQRADGGAVESEGTTSLIAPDEAERFHSRWEAVQGGFVDEPRRAVEEADGLVAELMQRLAETFSRERANLEAQWDRGGDVSTEDLRVALQRYRSFFERLLSL